MNIGSYGWYYIFPAIIILLSVLGKPSKWKGILVFLSLFFFTAFRGDYVGNDTMNYMESFNYIGGNLEFGELTGINSLGKNLEFINILLHRILYSLDFSSRSIITVYALITYLFLYFAYRLYKFDLLYFCLFYVLTNMFFMTFNLSRQMCAISILLVSYFYFIKGGKKNSIISVLYILLASSIHLSSLFSLIVFALKFIKIRRNYAIIITGFISSIFIVTVISPLTLIFKYLNIEYISRYMGVYDEYNRSIIGQLFSLIILISKLYLFKKISFNRNNRLTSDQLAQLELFFLSSVIIASMFDGANGMMGRIAMNFTIIQCLYLSILMENIITTRIKYKGDIIVATFLLLLLLFYGVGSYGYNGAFITGYYLMF